MRPLSISHSRPEYLRRAIGRATAVTPELVSGVLELMSARCAALNRAVSDGRVRRLIAVQAWTEAALALIALDPKRALRRINLDEGEWHCVLGSNWRVPDWLDDTVESVHEVLPLAILGALVTAAARPAPAMRPRLRSVPASGSNADDRPGSLGVVSCDNFS